MQTLSDQTAISKIRSPEELKEAKDKTENISTLKDLSNVQLASQQKIVELQLKVSRMSEAQAKLL